MNQKVLFCIIVIFLKRLNSSYYMKEIRCPFCNIIQKPSWCSNQWKYSTKNVSRYECECGKNFNCYISNNTYYTIPKTPQTHKR